MNMKDKDGFLLYTSQIGIFDKLTDEQAGKLIKAIYRYELTREYPNLDFGLDMAFTSIKIVLDKNREKYQNKCKKNKENADKRWGKDANVSKEMRMHTNNADIDNDYDTDIDIDTDYYHHNEIENNEDDSCVDDPIEFFKKNFNDNNALSEYQKNELATFVKKIGDRLVIYAMKKCVDYKATNLKYLKSIINNWQKSNVTTIEEAEKVDQEFQKHKNLPKPKYEYQQVQPGHYEELESLYYNI